MTPVLLTTLALFLLQADRAQAPAGPSREPAVLQTLIEQARRDLAARLSLPPAEVSVTRSAAVVWRNGSLGCPEPGMAYAEVLTPGYLIVLEAGGREHEYHSSRTGQLTYCKNPQPPAPSDASDL